MNRSLCLDQVNASPKAMVDVFQRRDAGRPIHVIGGPKTWLRWDHVTTSEWVNVLDFDGPADVWWPFPIPLESQL